MYNKLRLLLYVLLYCMCSVMAMKSEPLPGWLDNLLGPGGLLVAYVTGVLRTVRCQKSNVVEIVPVDMVVNALIATAWRTHVRFKERRMASNTWSVDEPQVFNYVSSPERPLSWSNFLTLSKKHHLPSVHSIWVPLVWFTRSKTVHRLLHVVLHLLPAYTVDTAALVFGVRTGLVKITRKVEKLTDVLDYFMMRKLTFSNLNTQQLWLSLSPQDQRLFPFSFAEHDWDDYFKSLMLGARQYLLKDDISTLPRATTKYRWFYWMNSTMKMVMFYIVARCVWQIFGLTSFFMFFSDFGFTYN